MLLEIGKVVSLLLSILSLDALLASAFFVPGSHWEERLLNSLMRILLAACVCFASGLVFDWHRKSTARPDGNTPSSQDRDSDVLNTLPVRLFAWSMVGMAMLFALSWYLEQYYVPMLWRNQPH